MERDVSLPWPEMQSSARPGETVRQMLDYICWIAQDLQLLGAHGPGEVATWRRQVGIAYRALVNPMIPGYGDPYPPDVPPARSPGLWPDVAAHDIPGMTLRHQLVVIGMLADQSRGGAQIIFFAGTAGDAVQAASDIKVELSHRSAARRANQLIEFCKPLSSIGNRLLTLQCSPTVTNPRSAAVI